MTQFHITNWSPDGVCTTNLATITDVIEEVDKVQRTGKPIMVPLPWIMWGDHMMLPPPYPVTQWEGLVCSVPSPW